MSRTQAQQSELDLALVPEDKRLKITPNNQRLKEGYVPSQAAFRIAIEILDLSPIKNALRISASVPQVYMYEFWTSIKAITNTKFSFNINREKKVFSLDQFREIFGFPSLAKGKKNARDPDREEIIELIQSLGYDEELSTLSKFNTSKIGQPWKAIFSILIRCLTGKSRGADSLRLSQARIFYGIYKGLNLDYASLMWEEFHYQAFTNTKKKSEHLQFPRFTKLIINYFMKADEAIDRCGGFFDNSEDDDFLLVNMRQEGVKSLYHGIPAPVPDNLLNDKIKKSAAYKTLLQENEEHKKKLGVGELNAPKPKSKRKEPESSEADTPTQDKGKRTRTLPLWEKRAKGKKSLLMDEDIEEQQQPLTEKQQGSGSGQRSKEIEVYDIAEFGDLDSYVDEPVHDEDDDQQHEHHDTIIDDIPPVRTEMVHTETEIGDINKEKSVTKSTSVSDPIGTYLNLSALDTQVTNTDPSSNPNMVNVPVTLATTSVISTIVTTPVTPSLSTIQSVSLPSHPLVDTAFMIRIEQRLKAQEDKTTQVKKELESSKKAHEEELARLREELANRQQSEESSRASLEAEAAKKQEKIERLRELKRKYREEKEIFAKANETLIESINEKVQGSLDTALLALRDEMKKIAASKLMIKSSDTQQSDYLIAQRLTDYELKKLLHAHMIQIGSHNQTPAQIALHKALKTAMDEDTEICNINATSRPYFPDTM